jgi:hypothetical protein
VRGVQPYLEKQDFDAKSSFPLLTIFDVGSMIQRSKKMVIRCSMSKISMTFEGKDW